MTRLPDLAQLRAELAGLLQESDSDRPLDSLESLVVRTYLTDRALAPAEGVGQPTTIEEWVAWVARHSVSS